MTGQMSGQDAAQGAPTFKRTCGTCTLCCKVYGIPATDSAIGSWCKHCEPGKGCGIWETRPDFCRSFFCNWIMLDWLGEEWRPDVSKIVFTMDPASGYLMFQVDPGRSRQPGRLEARALLQPDQDLGERGPFARQGHAGVRQQGGDAGAAGRGAATRGTRARRPDQYRAGRRRHDQGRGEARTEGELIGFLDCDTVEP